MRHATHKEYAHCPLANYPTAGLSQVKPRHWTSSVPSLSVMLSPVKSLPLMRTGCARRYSRNRAQRVVSSNLSTWRDQTAVSAIVLCIKPAWMWDGVWHWPHPLTQIWSFQFLNRELPPPSDTPKVLEFHLHKVLSRTLMWVAHSFSPIKRFGNLVSA